MDKMTIDDSAGTFDVTMFKKQKPVAVVLFAVGGGGNPERHLPLLHSLVDRGCSVVAPHFDRMVSPVPGMDDLVLRGSRLRRALEEVACKGVPTVGVGHSIGATVLLGLAGGELWMGPGVQVPVVADPRVGRLVLMAPATGYFQAAGALDAVHVPMQVWAGGKDVITPWGQVESLRTALSSRVPVEMHLQQDAGHFSFMDVLPPQVTDQVSDREAFLTGIAAKVGDFVVG